MWYCAHAIFYFKMINEPQDWFLVHENIYFIQAQNEKIAFEMAAEIGRDNEDLSQDGHLEVDGRKAAYIFSGVRKIIQIEPMPETYQIIAPTGIEVTYSVYEVDSLDQVDKLARGESIKAIYRE